MKRYPIILLILMSSCLYLSMLETCDLPTDPGPMPKNLINVTFEPGLNVFGVLRADGDSGSSFIHVEKALTSEQMYEEADIFDTTATVQITDSLTGDVFLFKAIGDTTYRGYYFNDEFIPESGRHYSLEIRSETLPTLTAVTTVPVRPELISNTLTITKNQAAFQLQAAVGVYQYNCYLFFGEDYLEKQVSNSGAGIKTITIDIADKNSSPTGLVIIGYDRNLTAYLNSSPSFIPQTFHEMVNTVENGYGCFGSLAVTVIGL